MDSSTDQSNGGNALQDWVGRSQVVQDEITGFPLNALGASLDRDDPPAAVGCEVPPLWHWLYFLPLHRPGQLRPDGHAQGGGLNPPVGLPRRVWAGSKFTWESGNPLRVGDQATRVSRIASITPKSGRSGELVFLTLVHEFHNGHGLSLTNEHQSVYRSAARSGASKSPPVLADTQAHWHREVVPDAMLLFRYSALTFNTHRIHFDLPYATGEEEYPALVVQGPLIATLLLDLLRRAMPSASVTELEFKAVRSAYAGRALHLRAKREGEQVRLWAADDAGCLVMQALARTLT